MICLIVICLYEKLASISKRIRFFLEEEILCTCGTQYKEDRRYLLSKLLAITVTVTDFDQYAWAKFQNSLYLAISHIRYRGCESEVIVNWGQKLEEQVEDRNDYSRFCYQVHRAFASLRDLFSDSQPEVWREHETKGKNISINVLQRLFPA